MKSLIYQTAGRLAKAIQKKEVTSEEVVQAHLAHIKKHNEKLNAIVILTAEEALKRAKEADRAFAKERIWGPLHGVPITIKEAFDVAGLKTTINFKQLKNNLAKRDAPVVARLKNAGAVILGKTNVPELLGGYQTDGHIYGRSNNPYNTDYTPGGSTGGGAAAVAAGFSPLELGSDFGGSIRIPSHFCGLYGLKPTENTVPMKGHVPPYPKARGGVVHMNTFGLLARAVEDIKLAFDIINGPDYRDVKVAPIQWKKPSGKTLSEYALAWSDTFGHFEAGKETRSLLQELAGKISSQGGNISKKNPPDFDFEKAWELWVKIWGYVMGQDIILPLGIIKGLKLNFARYARIIKKREELIAQLQAFFDDYDFWLCPVAMTPAFTHRKPGKSIEIDGHKVNYLAATGTFVTVFNVTGHPALVVPLGQSDEGLPIGLQIVGPYWSEPELFHFAEQLSELTPGFKAPQGYVE